MCVCVCVCLCLCVCLKKRNCRWPKQPVRAVWCKTRLLNSGGQFDQLCNLIGGAILARSTMLAHSPAIIAYGDGRPRSKVQGVCLCMCVCMYLCMCVFVCGCMVQWFVQSISSRNIAGSIPAKYGFTRLSSPSLSLGGYQQPNVYV